MNILFSVDSIQLSNLPPTVIFLNGTSSAGKTSLVEPLQALMETPFLHVGIDHFLFMLPSRYRMDGGEAHLGYHFKREGEEATISKGIFAHKISHAMRQSMHNLLSLHFNLIIDEVLFSMDDFYAYLHILKSCRVYFIAIKPPVAVVVEREKQRGNRFLGLARGLYNEVYRDKLFDLEIDSSRGTAMEIAQEIADYIKNHPTPQAFARNRGL